MGHMARPVYSLNGRTHNGSAVEDDAGEEDEADEEARKRLTEHDNKNEIWRINVLLVFDRF